jgi:elongation factor G
LPPAQPLKKVWQKAGPQLLEPMMKVEVVTPEEYMGDVIGDLNSRRGSRSRAWKTAETRKWIERVGAAGQYVRVHQHLRSMSQGRAQYTMLLTTTSPRRKTFADEVKAKWQS